jgi:hypothetical protein
MDHTGNINFHFLWHGSCYVRVCILSTTIKGKRKVKQGDIFVQCLSDDMMTWKHWKKNFFLNAQNHACMVGFSYIIAGLFYMLTFPFLSFHFVSCAYWERNNNNKKILIYVASGSCKTLSHFAGRMKTEKFL